MVEWVDFASWHQLKSGSILQNFGYKIRNVTSDKTTENGHWNYTLQQSGSDSKSGQGERYCNAILKSWFNDQINWYSLLDPHCLHITYLQVRLLAKIYLELQNQYVQCFPGHWGVTSQWWKSWVAWGACSQLRSIKATPPSCFSFRTVNKWPFHGLFSTMLFVFLCSVDFPV